MFTLSVLLAISVAGNIWLLHKLGDITSFLEMQIKARDRVIATLYHSKAKLSSQLEE